eukprot:gene3750-2646_t
MEGKNCFRTAWTQQPIYSGGAVTSVLLPPPRIAPSAAVSNSPLVNGAAVETVTAERELCLVMACGNAVHVVAASTGDLRVSFTLPTDDIVLSVDAVTAAAGHRRSAERWMVEGMALEPATTTVKKKKSDAVEEEDSLEESHSKRPNKKKAKREAAHASNIKDITTAATSREADEEEEEEDTVPGGSYIALGTRSLQIYVLRVDTVLELEAIAAPQHGEEEKEEEEEGQAAGVRGAAEAEAAPEGVQPAGITLYSCTVLKQWTAAQQAISCLHFTPRGHFLVSGATDGGVKLWNVFHHHLTHNLRCPGAMLIHAMAISSRSERFLVTGSFEGHVSVFDLKSKAMVASGRPHVQAVEALCFREEVEEDNSDPSPLSSSARERADGDGGVRRLTLFSIGRDRKVAVLRLNPATHSLEEVRRPIVVKEQLATAFFEGNAARLHTGSLDGIVKTYAIMADGGLTKVREKPKPPATNAEDRTEESSVRCIRPKWAINGTTLTPTSNKAGEGERDALFIADTGFNVHLLRPAAPVTNASSSSDALYTVDRTIVGYLDQVLEIKVLPVSLPYDRLVVNNSKDVRLYDGTGCLSSRCLQGHTDVVMSAAVSNDGRLIATAGKDMEVRFWCTTTWRCVAIGEKGHAAELTSLRFNCKQAEDYLLLFSISADENLRLWDVGKNVLPLLGSSSSLADGEEGSVHRFPPRAGVNAAHAGPVYAIDVAPNDQYVATGGKDKSVNLWTLNGKKIYREGVLKGHRRGVTSLAFSAADRVLASGSNDGTVRLWSLVSLTCIKTLQADKVAVLQVALFNQSTQLVSTNAEGVIRVWALGAGEAVWASEAHEEKIWALAVQERGDETVFLTGAADGVIIATEDCTAEEVQRIREERADIIHQEQELSNHIRRGAFKNAFALALRLDHPRHLRQVVERWTAQSATECETALQTEILPALSEPLLLRLLQFTREWLTNSRHAGVASVILRSFMASRHFQEIAKIGPMRQLVEPLLAYARKHSQRLHELLHKTYYVDYVTRAVATEALTSQPPYIPGKGSKQ